MAYKDNSIPIDHLKTTDLTVGDFHDIVQLLESATGHLVLPPEATAAMHRLLDKAASKI